MFKDFDFTKMQEMLESIQEKAKTYEEQLSKKEYVAKSGAGMVEVKVNAKFQVIDLKIDEELLKDKNSLEILLISALNDALMQATNGTKDLASDLFRNNQ